MDDANSLPRKVLHRRSDEQLAALARQGDKLAFEALVKRYEKALLAYAAHRMPAGRAEDAVQQSLFAAWMALQRGALVREPRPWLYQIVQNTTARMLRTRGGEALQLRESLAAHETTAECVERKAALRETLAALLRLPHQQRVALVQTSVEGRGQSEVAADLGVSDTAIRGLVYRARLGLRAAVSAASPWPLLARLLRASRGTAADQLARPEAVPSGEGLTLLVKGGAIALATGIIAVGGVSVRPILSTPPARGDVHRAASAPGWPGSSASRPRGTATRLPASSRTSDLSTAHKAPARRTLHADPLFAHVPEGAGASPPIASAPAAPSGSTAPAAREAEAGNGRSTAASGAGASEREPHSGSSEPGDGATETPAQKEAGEPGRESVQEREQEASGETPQEAPPPSGSSTSEERPATASTSEPGEPGVQLSTETPIVLSGGSD